MNNWLKNMNEKLDAIGAKLEKKEVTIPTDLAAAIVFFIVGIVLMLLVPSQVTVGSDEVVSGAAFPTYLCYLMIGGSVLVALQNIIKIVRKEPIERKTINALVEVKALTTGYVSRIKTLEVGNAAMMLGAGRQKKEDEIDHSVGILIKVKVGEFINEGDTLAIIHSNGKNTLPATEKLRDCFEISNIMKKFNSFFWNIFVIYKLFKL